MEMLLPLLTVGLTEGYKLAVGKFGKESTKVGIYLGVLVVSFIWTYVQNPDIWSGDFGKSIVAYFTTAIGYYEIFVKWLIKQQVVERLK